MFTIFLVSLACVVGAVVAGKTIGDSVYECFFADENFEE